MDSIAATIKITAGDTDNVGAHEIVESFDSEVDAVQDASMRNVGNTDDAVAYRAVRSTRFGTFESITGESLYL